jgi:hypothetical protein
MIIARQFIAWNASGRDPSRRERSEGFVLGTLPGLRRARSSRCYRSVPPGQLSQKIPKFGHIQPIKSRPESKGLIG